MNESKNFFFNQNVGTLTELSKGLDLRQNYARKSWHIPENKYCWDITPK